MWIHENLKKIPILRNKGPFVGFAAGLEENREFFISHSDTPCHRNIKKSAKNFLLFRIITEERTVMPSLFGGCL